MQVDCVRLLGGSVGVYSAEDIFHAHRILTRAGLDALREIQRKGIGIALRAGIIGSRMMETKDASRVRILNVDAPPGPFWVLSEHIEELSEEDADLALRKIGVLPPLPRVKIRRVEPELPAMEDTLNQPWSWEQVFGDRPGRKRQKPTQEMIR